MELADVQYQRIAAALERMADALERIADAQNGTVEDTTINKPVVPQANN